MIEHIFWLLHAVRTGFCPIGAMGEAELARRKEGRYGTLLLEAPRNEASLHRHHVHGHHVGMIRGSGLAAGVR